MLSRRTVNLGILANVGLAAGAGRAVAADLRVGLEMIPFGVKPLRCVG